MRQSGRKKIYGYLRASLSVFISCGALLAGTACSAESGTALRQNEEISAMRQTEEAEPRTSEASEETVGAAETITRKPDKIDDKLWELMENNVDPLPVTLWISDIDFEEVEKKVEAETGLSRDIIDRKSAALSAENADEELYKAREEQLMTDVQTYTAAQRAAAREMLIKSNNEFVDAYLSGAEDICVYEFFPVIDCSVTKEKIIYLASLDCVESVNSNADKDVVYPDRMIDE